MKKLYKKISWAFPISLSFFIAKFVLAADPLSRMSRAATKAGLESYAIPQNVVLSIVVYLLGFVGLIFLIMILVSGAQWLTSSGSEEKISHAKDRLKSAVIGLAIILVAYMITTFVAQVVIKSTCTGYYCYPDGGPSPCGNAATAEECLNIPGGYCYWLDGKCQQ